MRIRHLFAGFAVAVATVSLLAGCSNKEEGNSVRVGTIAGPETELMEVVKEVAKKEFALDVEIVQFTDYAIPNQALLDGSLDANTFQHTPYLTAFNTAKKSDLTPIGKGFIYPMGIYSQKHGSLQQVPKGAIVAIPNDPSNGARALLVLQDAGLIKLDPQAGVEASPSTIIANPHELKIKELDAAQLTRTLPDVDLALINTNWSMVAGLLPSRDALFVEPFESPYANLIVVRKADLTNPKLRALVAAFYSDAVVEKAKTLFEGQAVPAWKAKDQQDDQET